MKKICILGCGWLGLPLAKVLLEKGYLINGSTTTIEKIPTLKDAGIHPFHIELHEESIDGDFHSFLHNSELLVIDIPPKLRGNSTENFVKKIHNLIPFIEKSTVTKVLFVSSTSVYADDNSTVVTVTENTIPNPDTEGGKQLLQVEKLLQNNANFETIVLRFGGLIGDDRHPIKFLAGRKNIENPNGPINLIHQNDCIGIILQILRKAQNDKLDWNQTFNAVAPFHPTRKDYYNQKAVELQLPLPEFDETQSARGKIVSSEKVTQLLNYSFSKRVD
jgi:nucleoside-diphosphate-sugar epimerase